MTTARLTLPGLQSDLDAALSLMESRRSDYLAGEEFYLGKRAEVAASKEIRKLIDRNDGEKHTLSIAHVPVDALMDKVELQGITADSDDLNTRIAEALDANDFEEEADDWQRKAGYFGDYYIVVSPNAEDAQGNIAAADLDIVGRSPLDTIVMYDPATGRKPQYGASRWRDGKQWRALLYYTDATVQLVADANESGDVPDASDFEYDLIDPEDDQSAYIPHEGDRLLVSHIAIDSRPYGTPVHKKAWGPQESITKINAINLVNVDGQGLGARWALEDPAKEIDDDIDDDFGTNGPDTQGTGDGQTSAVRKSVRSVPGQIALLRGIKQVGQFDAAQSAEFTTNLEWYIRITAVITGTPLFEFDLNGEQPSGEARRRAEGRINKHARKVQRACGRAYQNVGDVIIALTGGGEAAVSATFRPVETSTDMDGFELIALKVKTGVPIAQAFREAGYTEQEVAEWFPKGEPNVNLDSLATLSAALQQLGQAKTLGVIGDAEIKALLPTVITEARGEGAPVAAVAPISAATTA